MQYVVASYLIPVIVLFWVTAPVIHCNDYRLPKSIKPEYYQLEILTYLDDIFEFNGKVLIKIKCFKSTDNIILHSTDLEIDEPNVRLHESGEKDSIKISKHSYDKENEFYIIKTDVELKENTNYELSIPFKGKLTEGLAGYYRSSYEDQKTGEKRWLAVTQFESTSARQAFPCFDEPEMKAVFKISLGHDKKYTSISNMPILKTEPINNTFVIDHFQDTVRMSTYLVAFVVSDFEFKYGEPPGNEKTTTEFRVWARKDAIDQVNFAAKIGPKYLKYYEDFFNITFPLPKQDMVAIPDFSAGAMENWGLITYRETALLYDPVISSTTSKHRVASVIAHELAHQWFGNLVTMKWWTDLWLNEGFATYMSAKAVHHINPEWNSLNEENVENMISVYTLDAMVSSHPVSVPIGNPNEIGQIFDTISYSKGSYILRMMNLFLGEDVFRQGLTNYLNKYAYSNAEQDDLWQSLTEEAHKQKVLEPNVTVKQIMDTWTIQTGYPLVTVTRDYENKVGVITQQRFIKSLVVKRTKENNPCWWIPLSYTTAKENNFNDTKPKAWFECETETSKKTKVIDLPGIDEWVLFNIQSAGLYKVNYDVQNWELLINALYENGENINVLNRVQLIDDAMDLAASGNLDYSIALKLLVYLVSETEYLAWNAALDHLSYLNTMLKRTPSYGLFEAYIRKIITPIYEKVAYEPAEKSADAVKRQVLISTWACRFNVGDCQEQSSELFKQWMKIPKPDSFNPIPKDLRGVVYCTALRAGGEKEWEFLWKRYLKSNVGSEKSTMLACLGCTEKMWLLSRYLQWTLNNTSGIRKQDIVSVFNSVASNNVGYFLAKDFLKSRIADINYYLGPKQDRLARYLKAISRQMISESELEELEEFTKRKTRFLKQASLGVEQAIEKVTLNIDWHKKYYDKVSKLLEEYGKS